MKTIEGWLPKIVKPRFNVIGCHITRTDFNGGVTELMKRIASGEGGYICFTNVHASVIAHNDPAYLAALNQSFMTLPDGKPLYWVGRAKGFRDIEQIAGPDFLPAVLGNSEKPSLRHYFYGGKPEVLGRLVARLKQDNPLAEIVGSESPPFRPLTVEEDKEAVSRINRAKPHIVWVGLGAPKQELWMAAHAEALKPAVLMGIGAAFDFYGGGAKRAPKWIRALGFEWLYRLVQEPRRLWRRYLVTNTLFITYLLTGLLK